MNKILKKHVGKSIIAIICILAMSMCFVGCEKNTGNTQADSGESFDMMDAIRNLKLDKPFEIGEKTTKEVPIYYFNEEDMDTLELAFFNKEADIPYLSLDEVVGLLEEAFGLVGKDEGYTLELEVDKNEAVLTRENGSWMDFDLEDDTITFSDWDQFLKGSTMDSLMDIVEANKMSDSAKQLFNYTDDSYERLGEYITLHLDNYGIDLIKDGDDIYVPFQLISDFILSHKYIPAVYNGECIIISNEGLRVGTPLGDIYFSAPTGKMSNSLATFNYNELCLNLDYHYGFKAEHEIKSFNEFFLETGLEEGLRSTDPQVFDSTLFDFIYKHLDDLHSTGINYSYLSGADFSPNLTQGTYGTNFDATQAQFKAAREAAYPNGMPAYEEVGNTAYITFDSFNPMPEDKDFYTNPPTEATMDDAVSLMIYAYSQITREGSPIENVVLDLSCNTGGSTDVASFVIATFLGKSQTAVKNNNTGAMGVACVQIDLNLDKVFDEKDSLQGYNLYCLESPVSFSCGNMVPNVFKDSNKITLLGQTSGGGGCMVFETSSASGAYFNLSGSWMFAVEKNGTFYNIDRGAEPDYHIGKIANFYDRNKLTNYINGLM